MTPSTPIKAGTLESCRGTITEPDGSVTTISNQLDDLGHVTLETYTSGDETLTIEHTWAGNEELKRTTTRGDAVTEIVEFGWADGKLQSQTHDYSDPMGVAGPDGAIDERRTFIYQGDNLVREEIDMQKASGALGPDGAPELIIEHRWDGLKRTTSVAKLKEMESSTTTYTYDENGLLTEARTKMVFGGESVVTHKYDSKQRRVETATVAADGKTVRVFEYCR